MAALLVLLALHLLRSLRLLVVSHGHGLLRVCHTACVSIRQKKKVIKAVGNSPAGAAVVFFGPAGKTRESSTLITVAESQAKKDPPAADQKKKNARACHRICVPLCLSQ